LNASIANLRVRNVIAAAELRPVARSVFGCLSPIFMNSGAGAMLYDVDGHEYLDYLMSWGALLLGHALPAVTRAIVNAGVGGYFVRNADESESQLAELIVSMMPSIERIRFVSS